MPRRDFQVVGHREALALQETISADVTIAGNAMRDNHYAIPCNDF